MRLRRRAGLLVLLIYLVACLGDESSGPRPVPSALEIAAGAVQTGVVVQPLDTALTVRVLDQHGGAMAGVLVQFVIADTAGSLSSLTRTTGPDGLAATVWTLPQAAGSYAVLARVAELDSVTFQAEAGPAAASQLLIVAGDSQWTTVGQALDSAVRVRVVDPFGNVVAGQLVSFVVQSGGGSISSTSAITDSLGQAEARWTLGAMPAVGALRVASLSLLPAVAKAYGFPVQRPDSLSFGNATCHLPASGGLRCWGPGASRPLGTGDTSTAFTPVTLPLAENFVSLHGGDRMTCGLTVDGTAWCWGQAAYVNSDVPVQLTPKHSWQKLTFGGRISNASEPLFFCAVSKADQGFCWGIGPIGDGSSSFSFLPTLIAGGRRWRTVDAGYDYACGVTTRAIVYCWGANGFGQLGNGTTAAALAPVPILSDERFHSVTTSPSYACALTLDGRAYCWGQDFFGSTGPSGGGPVPKPVDDATRFATISIDSYRGGCGITLTGETRCWGSSYGIGPQYGGGYLPPTRIAGDPGFIQLAAGENTTCGVDGVGDVWCWGYNGQGNAGIGDTRRELSPAPVSGGLTLSHVVTGTNHACGLTTLGEAWCWGGLLGDGTRQLSVVPVAALGGTAFSALTAAGNQTCGLATDDRAYCWGFSLGGWVYLPTLVPGGYTFGALTAGAVHSCGITTSLVTVCWGYNTRGQLGDSTFTDQSAPVQVSGGHTFTQVVAGVDATCALDTAGAAFCWGDGRILGDGTSTDRAYPAPVSGGLAFQRLAAPVDGVACGVTRANEAWCWGLDSGTRFGSGSSGAPQPVPEPVSGGHQFTDIHVGGVAACGLSSSGTALCWGSNSQGSLGTGDITGSAVPVPVAGGFTYSALATGTSFACALEGTGQARCWGYNALGELGNGESAYIPVPSRVP